MKRFLTPLLCIITVPSFAQDSIMPRRYYAQLEEKTQKVNFLIRKKTQQSLNWLISREQHMRAKLKKSDPAAAHRIFDRSIDSLQALKSLSATKLTAAAKLGRQYNSYFDTLQVAAKFLPAAKDLQQKVGQLQGSIGQSEQISAYIRERQRSLKDQLGQYTLFTKDLQRLGKQAYYYQEQVREYTSILQDRKKAETKAMELLRKSSAFREFFQQNSVLAGLFNTNNDVNAAQALGGLQTRSQVEQLLQQRIGNDPDARQAITAQVNQARDQFNTFKEKFPMLNNSAEMPDFKPSQMKTRRWVQRMEFGGNIQFQRASNWYPTIGDIALQAGYKFSEKGSAGIGLAYKLGLGSLDRIAISNKGVGIRSFVDYRIKNAFSLNGGMEMNHYAAFSHIAQLKNWNGWQRSALLGMRYTYKASPRLKGNITVLYDFLARQQAPFAEPLKIRFGYSK
ncbi:hypothetical protein [Chitinophaga pinensis]|uniref:Uncharacterized protein n=1 Tax=Chitinophaga pinensis (strain ATCC 43595 / DSM 2588 / LMG 13176 / NBRC 15968 / NCIMB 11800 / UQM 2034) TaxID=485918 RepID=A0A979GW82_CHIPD|nr:hypothetical protein [Chitinophaga pinensis]ACU61834.1 hypothetical protein Cpin_4388 [Chitinophaga pinensis DSM 2588]